MVDSILIPSLLTNPSCRGPRPQQGCCSVSHQCHNRQSICVVRRPEGEKKRTATTPHPVDPQCEIGLLLGLFVLQMRKQPVGTFCCTAHTVWVSIQGRWSIYLSIAGICPDNNLLPAILVINGMTWLYRHLPFSLTIPQHSPPRLLTGFFRLFVYIYGTGLINK